MLKRCAAALVLAAIFTLHGAVASSHEEADCLREFREERALCRRIFLWFCQYDEEAASQRCKSSDHPHRKTEAQQEEGDVSEPDTENR